MLTPAEPAESIVRRLWIALFKLQPHPHGDLLDAAVEFLSRHAEQSEMLALQAQLAYSAARSDIECYCAAADADFGGRWYDTTHVLNDDHETVATAVRYLDLRGLIERHSNGMWVRVRNEA